MFCNGSETCGSAGACLAGTAPVLDDAIACTTDACDESADTITHVGDNAQCADTDPCTNDVCQPGTGCTHPVVCACTLSTECDDQNPCTDDSCTPQGNCAYANNSAACDDGSFCTGADTCSGGSCSVHAGDPCSGGAECASACDETNDSCNLPPGTACTADGNPCTNDQCNGGGACAHPNNSASCSDNLFCNGTDTCSGGSCSAHAGDPCTGGAECANVCDETGDSCNLPSGTACTADSNPCTNDQCNGSGACAHPNNAASCNDNLYCNGADTCSGGSCSAHTGDSCTGGAECSNSCDETNDNCNLPSGTACTADGNPCTNDECNGGGTCGHPNNSASCSDTLYCNGADTCSSGACSLHAGDPCTGGPVCNGTCNESGDNCFAIGGVPCQDTTPDDCLTPGCSGAGTCDQAYAARAMGAPCDDALFCTGTDTCDASAGCTVHAGDPCTPDACDEAGNVCLGPPHFTSIVSGGGHSCGLTADGVAYCWGQDTYGALGNGGTSANTQSPSPVDTAPIAGNKALVQLVAGYVHTCGLTADGVAYCWGDDSYGQLGNGGTSANTQSPSPVDTAPIAGNKVFVQLTTGWNHTCGLTADGLAYCWGYDGYGGLGNGGSVADTQSPSAVDTAPIAGNKAFVQLTGGRYHTCGLTAAGVGYCWGFDGNGTLGNGGTGVSTQSPSPVDTAPITGNKTLVQMTAGGFHTCGLTAARVAYCWGSDASGEGGNGGTAADTQSPSAVDTSTIAGNPVFLQLSAGSSHTCGRTASGATYCWGSDLAGQLGNAGTAADVQSPSSVDTTVIALNKAFVQVASGVSHTCGLTADGGAYCWGLDLSGQLGNGGTAVSTQSPSAVNMSPVAGTRSFLQVTVGGSHTCGFTPEGVAYCWGSDAYGQLGNGGTSVDAQSPAPVDTSVVAGNKAFVQLTAGTSHSCGLTAEGVVYCWGYDSYGQLGNGAGVSTQSPSAVDLTPVTSNNAFIQIVGGERHTCGLTVEGVAYCWGYDFGGQLGNGGTSVDTQSPSAVDTTPISGSKAFVQLVAGAFHTCGLTSTRAAYCWGDDSYGELGNGGTSAYAQSPSPVDTAPITGNKAFINLTAGTYHTCGQTADGVAYCWGLGSSGQLGNGGTATITQSPSAVNTVPITGNKAFIRLTGGGNHTCGLTAQGVAYCSGADTTGQLGNGGTGVATQSPSAVDTTTIAGNKVFVQISAGFAHTCGLTAGGMAYCWGSDVFGGLGNGGTSANVQSPSLVDVSGL